MIYFFFLSKAAVKEVGKKRETFDFLFQRRTKAKLLKLPFLHIVLFSRVLVFIY